MSTVYDLFRDNARLRSEAAAVRALHAADLSYHGMIAQLDRIMTALMAWGIGRGDRVAIQLPNGPEALLALHGVGTVAIAVPMDPRAGSTESDYLLGFIEPKAIVLQQGVESSGRAYAAQHGLRVVEIVPTPNEGAGTFTFADAPSSTAALPVLNGPDELSYLIPTSGTTAMPKLVPRTQTTMLTNIHFPARTQARVLGDVLPVQSMTYLPMHLMFGFMNPSSSLATGGAAACLPAFDLSQIFHWLSVYRPDFFAATPAILEQVVTAAHTEDPAQWQSVRFIYTGSSPLSETLRQAVNAIFHVPIVHTYGMTEVGNIAQLILNPDDPMPEGLVGRPTQPENVRIMAEDGALLATGATGEVVVRSELYRGYWNNPEANAEATVDNWFRTGDMGYLSADGQLFLTGRVKEVINSGGAKVSPLEVETVLLQHPQVREAAVFGLKNADVGEVVAAAVVGDVTERALRKFAAERLPFYKVPARIILVDQIPKAESGKVPRNQLAKRLGLV